MIRSIVREANFMADEEEEASVQQKSADSPQEERVESYEVQTIVDRPRLNLVRRSSSAVGTTISSLPLEEKPDGGDKSLRPRYLQERSATLVHIMPTIAGPSRAPRSKASAFLLSVLSKSKGMNGTESRRVSLEPLRNTATNSLHYVAPEKAERGIPLRTIGRNESRRYGRQSSVDPPANTETPPSDGGLLRRLSASQEHMVATVRGLQANKQHLPQQLEILHSILRYVNSLDRDDDGKRPILKDMVDAGIIPELASIMREFRFNINLQICVMSILSALAEESVVYAYTMTEFDLERLLQKTAVVHAAQDRMVMLASTLLHAVEESKQKINLAEYQAEKVAKVRRQSACYTDMLVAALAVKPKHSPSLRRSSAMLHASEMARIRKEITADRAVTRSAPTSKIFGCGHSGGRHRQAFDLELAPPALSKNFRLMFAQKLKRPETAPVEVKIPDPETNDQPSSEQPLKRDRPASSPTRRSTPPETNSRSLAAIYSAGSILVEPSPGLQFRGSSAGGVRKKPMPIHRRNTGQPIPRGKVMTPSSARALLTPLNTALHVDAEPPQSTDSAATTTMERDDTSTVVENENQSSQDIGAGDNDAEKMPTQEEEGDESYEDDFDTGDDSDGGKRMLDCRAGSDGELIDMVHTIAAQDPVHSRSESTPRLSEEANAATTIQRHIRGALVRRKIPRPTCSEPDSRLSQATINSTIGKNGKKKPTGDKGIAKRVPLSARTLRHTPNQQSRRRETFSNKTQVKAGPRTTRSRTSETTKSAVPARTKIDTRPQTQQHDQHTLQTTSWPEEAPLNSIPTNEDDQETTVDDTEAVSVKAPVDPEALKQIQALYAEGLQHHKENHLGLAIDCYDRALLVPGGRDFASLHVNLGSALMAQGKFSQALASFEEAKRIQPGNIKAIYNYSLALLHLDRPREAKQQLRHILELEPSHEKATLALSHLAASSAFPVKSPT